MGKIKIDNRIRTMIEDGVVCGHRSMFIIVGDKAKDQVPFLHHILLKSRVNTQPTVLWCYQKDLDFSSHRNKKVKSMKKKATAGKLNINENDPFETFVISTQIKYYCYKRTPTILGNTFSMCILQDFEALTPNRLARTVETVEGGGVIVFLLQNIKSLKEFYTIGMNVHKKFKTEAYQNVDCRFNERFLLSLTDCKRCLVLDDQLNVLPISSHNLNIKLTPKVNLVESSELTFVKKSLEDTQPVGSIVNCCKTIDQAKALLKFIEALSERTMKSTVSLTAARGRGKSAALGLAIAGAIAFGYSNIFITSPSPENLKTLFEFVEKGFEALNYKKTVNYEFLQSRNKECSGAVVGVNVFVDNKFQYIQYIDPTDAKGKLKLAELLVIDEAAAIPLTHIKAMLGPYLVFMASTINGYEGTGRSLSLKLLQQLRAQTVTGNSATKQDSKQIETDTNCGRVLQELTLEEPIRYKAGDSVEKWLTDLLCLDATVGVAPISSGMPSPKECQLYYINRDTLFSYHKASELFLKRMMAIYVSAHYKNTPDDLQMMSDAPAHHLFCLMGPIDPKESSLPEILVVIQITLEGQFSKSTIENCKRRGRELDGDLIPCKVLEQYLDVNFPLLKGARIVRIATHPDYQRLGYGKRALELLRQYYQGFIPLEIENPEEEDTPVIEKPTNVDINLLEETVEPKKVLPPLLLKLSERRPEPLDYLGVSFGVTETLLKFWKKAKFVPIYLSQKTNDITGEHSCVMLSSLQDTHANWLENYWKIFRQRIMRLLFSAFRDYPISLALAVLENNNFVLSKTTISKEKLQEYVSPMDMKMLEEYSDVTTDYHCIIDLVSPLAMLYFKNLLPLKGDKNDQSPKEFKSIQRAILLGFGLQGKDVEQISKELNIEQRQVLGNFRDMIKKATTSLKLIIKDEIENQLNFKNHVCDENIKVNVENVEATEKQIEMDARKVKKDQIKQLQELKNFHLEQYAIKGSEEEWNKNLTDKRNKSLISIKSTKKRSLEDDGNSSLQEPPTIKNKKTKKIKKKHSL